MSHPLVVHCKKAKYDVYIGRSRDRMHFGNPFSHQSGTLAQCQVSTRDDAVDAYSQWLRGEGYHDIEPERRQWILDNLAKLKGKILGCWCAPRACHGDVLACMAERL